MGLGNDRPILRGHSVVRLFFAVGEPRQTDRLAGTGARDDAERRRYGREPVKVRDLPGREVTVEPS